MIFCQYCLGLIFSRIKCDKCKKGIMCINCDLCDQCLLHHSDEQLNDLIKTIKQRIKTIENIISNMNNCEKEGRIIITDKRGKIILEEITPKYEEDKSDLGKMFCEGVMRIDDIKFELKKRPRCYQGKETN